MDPSNSAEIIAFPVRRQSDLLRSAQRLSDALTNLSTALAEQREATRRWRDALRALSERMATAGNPTV